MYKCKVLLPDGSSRWETVSAENEDKLRETMRKRNLKIISLKRSRATLFSGEKSERRMSTTELAVFCEQLHFVLNSHTSLLRGLSLLKEDGEGESSGGAVGRLHSRVEQGNSIADSMRDMGRVFPSLLINMVEGGEKSGNLPAILNKMTLYYKKQGDISKKLRTMLIQPLFLLVTALGLMTFFLYYILPGLIESMEIEFSQLPLITRLVVSFSGFITGNIISIVLFFVFAGVGFSQMMRNDRIALFVDTLLLKIPIVGKTVVYLESYKMCSLLGLLIHSGVTLHTSLGYIKEVMGNRRAKNCLETARKHLFEGHKFSAGLQEGKFFTSLLTKTVEIGEETGTLDTTLLSLSFTYEDKLDTGIKKTLALAEPLITMGIGLFVAILVISIAIPLFTMMDHIKM